MRRIGSQLETLGKVKPVARPEPTVASLDAFQDHETSCAQAGDGPGGGVLGDPDAGGYIPDTDGCHPGSAGPIRGESEVLEGGPRAGRGVAAKIRFLG